MVQVSRTPIGMTDFENRRKAYFCRNRSQTEEIRRLETMLALENCETCALNLKSLLKITLPYSAIEIVTGKRGIPHNCKNNV